MSPALLSRPYRTSRPSLRRFALGPFVGMRDAIEPTATSDPGIARLLKNVYPREPQHGAGVVGRPGFVQMGAQLASGGDVQFIGQYTEIGGDEHTIAIVGGKFYTYNWNTDTWTEVVEAAVFSSASITVATSGRIYGVPFAGQMVFTDGANTPWMWDGTSAGGLTKLTNAPVIFGKPTVYYGKLFAIKNAERSTFVWSEENDATTGYEAGGFNNAWTLSQTDTNRLTALLGANEALYVWRDHSTTQIVGEVTTNFASTGTRDGVSNTVGTSSPASVFFDGRDVFFADASGRPHVIKPGTEALPIWEDFDQTIRAFPAFGFDNIEGYRDPTLELAVFGYQESVGPPVLSKQICYHATTGGLPGAAAVFEGYSWNVSGITKDQNTQLRVLHGDDDGHVYMHGLPTETVWDDGLAAGTEAIAHEIRTNWVGYTESTEHHFTRADFVVIAKSSATIEVYGESPTGVSSATSVSFTGSSADDGQHGAVGLNQFGFAGAIRVLHDGEDEQFWFVSATLEGRPLSRYPGMP